MKIRFIASEQEFDRLLPELLKQRRLFDGWRNPQYGSNPKYADDPNMLMYTEISVDNFLTMITPEAEVTIDTTYTEVRDDPEKTQQKGFHALKTAQKAIQRHLGDGTSLIIRPKK